MILILLKKGDYDMLAMNVPLSTLMNYSNNENIFDIPLKLSMLILSQTTN